MAVALDLARLAEGRTSPNPLVGAVVVRKGRIIGRGFHRGPGYPHAEIEALKEASRGGPDVRTLRGTTLYITLEPCCPPKTGGRTPPCTDAILKSGIRDIVIGMKDPDRRVSGRGIALLKKKGLRVRVGVLEEEGRALNEAYIMHRTKKRPFVILKMATTVDGKVGFGGRSAKITGPEADGQVHALRDRVDAVLVGIGTILSDDPRLTTRLSGGKGRDPIRVVLDSRLRIPPRSRVFSPRSSAPVWIATTLGKGHPKVRRFRRRGAELLFMKEGRWGGIDLQSLLQELGRRGVLSLLVEGGPRVWLSFLEKGWADRLWLFVAPKKLGPRGLPAFPRAPRQMGLRRFTAPRRIGRDLFVEGIP